jgi:NADH-quinone oxidoreductase subunit L
MTAFYMFRLCFLTFTGEPRDQHRFEHAHESPYSMTIPLMILAFLSIFAGWVGLPWLHNGFASFVYYGEHMEHHPSYILMVVSTIVAVSGIGLAYLIYYKKVISADALAEKFSLPYKLSFHKFYFDEIYDFLIINPLLGLANVMWWFDGHIIDGLVNFAGWFTIKWADVKMWFDKWIIDGTVNGLGFICMGGSWLLKFIQTGSVQFYTLIIMVAATGLVIYRVTPEGFLYYLAGIILVALARLLTKMVRPARAKTGSDIEG